MALYKAIKDNDNGVFKSPVTSKINFGYKLVNTYFVDNSGFGSDNEPALTASQFLTKVKAGFYYGIVDVGQFQIYIGEFVKDITSKKELLKAQGLVSRKKIGNNTYEKITCDGKRIIQLHSIDILTFSDNKVIINSGGYKTHTTKERINNYLSNGYRLTQKDFKWYISRYISKDGIAPIVFYDGIELPL